MRRFAIDRLLVHQPDGSFAEGSLYVAGDRFSAPFETDDRVDGEGMLACPGLIDVHTHGRLGTDFCDATEKDLAGMAADYVRHGVTTVLPTLASATLPDWQKTLARIKAADEPAFPAVHLEGNWLSPARRGAHAAHLLTEPTREALLALLGAGAPVWCATYAPELDTDGAFLAACLENGVHASIGHTDCDYETACRALAGGADSFTHLFNTMPPLHHRAGGPVAAALTSDAYAELICDGLHVSPEIVRLAYAAKREKLLLITDSMAGTGMPDGVYAIAGQEARLENGVALSPDGKLAGSTLDLLRGVQNLAAFCGIPFGKALLSATAAPAAYLGLQKERGSLAAGALADAFFLRSESDPLPTRVLLHGEDA